MKVGVFGTGVVGRVIAAKLVALGHDVMVGTRSPAETLSRTTGDQFGNAPFAVWAKEHPQVRLGTFAEAAAHADLAVNALSGQATLEGLGLAGAERLAGKILVDIANPLDFSRGMPPSLTVANTDSLGEQVQRALPTTKVVKTLNTVNAFLMVDAGSLKDGAHTMFVCGDDATAKATVTGLLREGFGWRDVIDLGGIDNARATEMLVTLWVRLWGTLKTTHFNIAVVR
jgi:predicted dinucleotide-binding enzyme